MGAAPAETREITDVVNGQQAPAHARETLSGQFTRVTLEVLAFATATGTLFHAVRCFEQGEYLKGGGFAVLSTLLYVAGARTTRPSSAAERERNSETGATSNERRKEAPYGAPPHNEYAPRCPG